MFVQRAILVGVRAVSKTSLLQKLYVNVGKTIVPCGPTVSKKLFSNEVSSNVRFRQHFDPNSLSLLCTKHKSPLPSPAALSTYSKSSFVNTSCSL